MNILIHICCANCAVYPVMVLKERQMNVKCLWFNPNIHPYMEYRARIDGLMKLQKLWNLDVDYQDYYGLIEFLRAVSGKEEDRCEYCYRIRLEETAKKAKEIPFDAFTTSLLVSPYQKFDMIVDIGKQLEQKYSIRFLAEDFRGGFKAGKRISRGFGIYQQKYCGCIYSEMERHLKKS